MSVSPPLSHCAIMFRNASHISQQDCRVALLNHRLGLCVGLQQGVIVQMPNVF